MSEPIVYLNGAFVPESEAKVSVFDRCFLYGDGIFEGIAVWNRAPFRLKPHLDRLTRGLRYMMIDEPMDHDGWRRVIAATATLGIPAPAMSSALAFYDGYRRERLAANLTQAQRDYFGAHTYERIDRPRDQFFHTNWTGTGGNVTARAYKA